MFVGLGASFDFVVVADASVAVANSLDPIVVVAAAAAPAGNRAFSPSRPCSQGSQIGRH